MRPTHDFSAIYRRHQHHFADYARRDTRQSGRALHYERQHASRCEPSSSCLPSHPAYASGLRCEEPKPYFPRPGPFEQLWNKMKSAVLAGTAAAMLTAAAIGYANHLENAKARETARTLASSIHTTTDHAASQESLEGILRKE